MKLTLAGLLALAAFVAAIPIVSEDVLIIRMATDLLK
jgi:hypothetical protein